MALGDDARVERPGEADRDPVVGLVHLGRVAALDPEDLRALDQALGPQEADRQLVLEAGRPHRDRDRDRLLARTGGPDLERLLADDAVAAELERRAADGDDPGRRDVAGRGRRLGHRTVPVNVADRIGWRRGCRHAARMHHPRCTPESTSRRARSTSSPRPDGDPRDDRAGRRAAARPDLLRRSATATAGSCLHRRSTRSRSGSTTRATSPASATSSRDPTVDAARRPLVRGLVGARLAAARRPGRRSSSRTIRAAAEHATAVAALRAKYPQYASHRLEERPLIRIAVERVAELGQTSADAQRSRKSASAIGRRQWVELIASW